MSAESSQPHPPELSLPVFRQLCALAAEYHQLAPWEFLSDSDMLGITDPQTGSLRLVSVMGNARQIYGLLIHRGEQGLRSALTLAFGDESEFQDPNFIHGQDGILLEFVPRRELENHDLNLLKKIGFQPLARVKRQLHWPKFRSTRPGAAPWPLDQTEAEMFLADLRKTIDFARLVGLNPRLLRPRRKQVALYPNDPNFAGPLRPEDIDWQELTLAPASPAVAVELTKEECKALAALPKNDQLSLEVDCLYSPALVAGDSRPYFPWLVLIVDAISGHIVGTELANSQTESMEQVTARCLIRTTQEHNCRPKEILVCRRNLAVSLAPLSRALAARLLQITSLPWTQRAYHEFKRLSQESP